MIVCIIQTSDSMICLISCKSSNYNRRFRAFEMNKDPIVYMHKFGIYHLLHFVNDQIGNEPIIKRFQLKMNNSMSAMVQIKVLHHEKCYDTQCIGIVGSSPDYVMRNT